MKSEKDVLEKVSKLVKKLTKSKFLKIFRNLGIYTFMYMDKVLLLFIKKPKKQENKKKQVLLFPNLGIGDAIQFLTTIEKYRKAYPKDEYEITFMCRGSVIDIIKNESDFDYYEVINVDEGLFNLAKRYKILKQINSKYYDILIDAITPLSCSMNLYISLASYAKERITLVNRKVSIVPEKMLKKAYTKIYYTDNENFKTIEMYNLLVDNILGNPNNSNIDFHRTKEYEIHEELPNEYYMIFPSSKLEEKKWNIEKYAEIITKIYDKTKLTVVFCGTKDDEKTLNTLIDIIKVPFIRIEHQMPIMEYIQLIKNSKFVISNDSGAYHIAVSENVPVTVITGKYAFDRYMVYDFESNYQYKKPYIVKSQKNNCKNCFDNCPYFDSSKKIYPCLEEIQVDDAWEVINEMIENNYKEESIMKDLSIVNNIIDEQIENLQNLKNSDYCSKIDEISEAIINCLKNGNKVLIAGNGGSASDAQHFAGEIVGRFLLERKGLACVCLNTDTSVMTCIANDYGYDDVFSRQIEGIGKDGDIFIGISTSGNSKNIVKAVEKAKEMNIKTFGFLGKDGGKLKDLVDSSLIIPYSSTARVQEHHIMSIHLICEIVEKELANIQ